MPGRPLSEPMQPLSMLWISRTVFSSVPFVDSFHAINAVVCAFSYCNVQDVDHFFIGVESVFFVVSNETGKQSAFVFGYVLGIQCVDHGYFPVGYGGYALLISATSPHPARKRTKRTSRMRSARGIRRTSFQERTRMKLWLWKPMFASLHWVQTEEPA